MIRENTTVHFSASTRTSSTKMTSKLKVAAACNNTIKILQLVHQFFGLPPTAKTSCPPPLCLGVPVSNMVSPKIAGCPGSCSIVFCCGLFQSEFKSLIVTCFSANATAAVFLNAPSSRPGIDIFMSMPPKITATFKEPAWQAKLHAFAPKKQQ